jgi:methyl-accepting chemotaxis protein
MLYIYGSTVEDPHKKIHELAKEAVTAYNSVNKTKAEQIYKEVESASKQVIICI